MVVGGKVDVEGEMAATNDMRGGAPEDRGGEAEYYWCWQVNSGGENDREGICCRDDKSGAEGNPSPIHVFLFWLAVILRSS